MTYVKTSDVLAARLGRTLGPCQQEVIDLLAADETFTNRQIEAITGHHIMTIRSTITKLRKWGVIGKRPGDRRIRV